MFYDVILVDSMITTVENKLFGYEIQWFKSFFDVGGLLEGTFQFKGTLKFYSD